jgi:hypothetical protein
MSEDIMIKAPFTMFGVTKDVPVIVIVNGVHDPKETTWDEEYYAERHEDLYGLRSQGKKVRLVTGEAWQRA